MKMTSSLFGLVSMNVFVLIVLTVFVQPASSNRLTVSGTSFMLNNNKVFLSGGNLAWINYGCDYGYDFYPNTKPKVEEQFKLMKQAGGNTMRIWIHCECVSSPLINETSGYVIAPDNNGKFLGDVKDLLDTAEKYDILVIPTLWSAGKHPRLHGLINDTKKLQSYIDIVLKPLATKLKGHKALGAYDICNEPEGILIRHSVDTDPCFDTRGVNFGIGWHGAFFDYKHMLRFINLQSAAIKSVDPGALVTVGIWEGKVITDKFNMVNRYSDDCLRKAGGKKEGVLDFYSVHGYSNAIGQTFDSLGVFKHSAPDYGVNKPIVVGE
ncbi:mannan endo-1,4-beta-mannosidase, partial [Aplysia californica]|uniref:Mannan endo-1,4-beta-mannosidase n=1 Tax=Aplysia californica TaxID=6500 RepID=A0ABM0JJZ6_APLCA